MIRMLIVGYVFAIRSERALCRDVRVNLAYRWFCGLSIEDKIPDHSAFSRARNERFRDSGIFRSVFERVVGACIGAGLVGGEGFAVDASLIVADARLQKLLEVRIVRAEQFSSSSLPLVSTNVCDAATETRQSCCLSSNPTRNEHNELFLALQFTLLWSSAPARHDASSAR